MNKTATIFKYELLTTLKRKGFIITTVAIPLLALLGILIFNIIHTTSKPAAEIQITNIGYVDRTGIFVQATDQGNVKMVPFTTQDSATTALTAKKVKEFVVIPPEYLSSGLVYRYSMSTNIEPPAQTVTAVRQFLIDNLLAGKVDTSIITRIQSPLAFSSTVLDETGNKATGQGGWSAWFLSYLFGILLIMAIFTASGYLLQGLSEEKENRVMEILLSSVSTRQLITGKVLALGVTGLVQMLFWLLSAHWLLNLASSSIGGFFSSIEFPLSITVLSLVYFILGYFLFAILMAGTGAVVPSVRDAQQYSVIFSLLASIPFFMITFIVEKGDHIVNKILTIFPFTAPMTVIMRLNAGVPVWELAVSIIFLLLAILGSLVIAAKVFRVYLLMYGKTPAFGEIIKSLRQA
jgi:ABC-2 type transport system permease protein